VRAGEGDEVGLRWGGVSTGVKRGQRGTHVMKRACAEEHDPCDGHLHVLKHVVLEDAAVDLEERGAVWACHSRLR
jgi:hypothetical protein